MALTIRGNPPRNNSDDSSRNSRNNVNTSTALTRNRSVSRPPPSRRPDDDGLSTVSEATTAPSEVSTVSSASDVSSISPPPQYRRPESGRFGFQPQQPFQPRPPQLRFRSTQDTGSPEPSPRAQYMSDDNWDSASELGWGSSSNVSVSTRATTVMSESEDDYSKTPTRSRSIVRQTGALSRQQSRPGEKRVEFEEDRQLERSSGRQTERQQERTKERSRSRGRTYHIHIEPTAQQALVNAQPQQQQQQQQQTITFTLSLLLNRPSSMLNHSNNNNSSSRLSHSH